MKIQSGSCNGQNSNGVRLHDFVQMPITLKELQPDWLTGWDQAVVDIRKHPQGGQEDQAQADQGTSEGARLGLMDHESLILGLVDAYMEMTDDGDGGGADAAATDAAAD